MSARFLPRRPWVETTVQGENQCPRMRAHAPPSYLPRPREEASTGRGPMPICEKWFAPCTTPRGQHELRVRLPPLLRPDRHGGPDGKDMPNRGVLLRTSVPTNGVFTDAYTKAWEPSEKTFMTVSSLSRTSFPASRDTRARAPLDGGHSAHEKMGFTRAGNLPPPSSLPSSPRSVPPPSKKDYRHVSVHQHRCLFPPWYDPRRAAAEKFLPGCRRLEDQDMSQGDMKYTFLLSSRPPGRPA